MCNFSNKKTKKKNVWNSKIEKLVGFQQKINWWSWRAGLIVDRWAGKRIILVYNSHENGCVGQKTWQKMWLKFQQNVSCVQNREYWGENAISRWIFREKWADYIGKIQEKMGKKDTSSKRGCVLEGCVIMDVVPGVKWTKYWDFRWNSTENPGKCSQICFQLVDWIFRAELAENTRISAQEKAIGSNFQNSIGNLDFSHKEGEGGELDGEKYHRIGNWEVMRVVPK